MKLYFAPDFPEKLGYLLTNILNYLDYEVVLTPQPDCDAAGLWEDATFINVPKPLEQMAQSKFVINGTCTDIGKEKVDEVFTEVFGYSSLVDPTSYQGVCIKKSNLNCDGFPQLVNCPLKETAPGYVYQKFIRNEADGFFWEYRVPVIFDEIPRVYHSKKNLPEKDFKTVRRQGMEIKMPEDVFSEAEYAKIISFCHKVGMDVGELDILRDPIEDQLYIIDANKTAAGYSLVNRSGWGEGERKRMLPILAESFSRGLRKRIEQFDREP